MRRSLRAARHLVFALLVAGCAALLILNVQAWRGGLVEDDAPPSKPPRQAAGASSIPVTAEEPRPAAQGASGPGQASAAASATTLSIRATRGPCWMIVRAGSRSGEILFEGVLERGQEESFSHERIWMRVGATGNVEIAVNGRQMRDVAGGTIDLVATGDGIRPAAEQSS